MTDRNARETVQGWIAKFGLEVVDILGKRFVRNSKRVNFDFDGFAIVEYEDGSFDVLSYEKIKDFVRFVEKGAHKEREVAKEMLLEAAQVTTKRLKEFMDQQNMTIEQREEFLKSSHTEEQAAALLGKMLNPKMFEHILNG